MLNINTQIQNLNQHQHSDLFTCVDKCCTQHRTVLIIFPENLQTVITAQTLKN